LLRLLQLTSPALPVGAYAYSQGLEHAVDAGWVHDEDSAADWIIGLLEHALAQLDAPVLVRLHAAWCASDSASVHHWNRMLQASRESAELLAEDRHLGAALSRLLAGLDVDAAAAWTGKAPGFAAMFALAAVRWDIPCRDSVSGFLWSWSENQVAAAIKLVPLGQTAGQRILSRAVAAIPAVVERALAVRDDEIGFLTPALAIGSALHETQYSRLFRS
jgi:urease accessory protein